MAVCVQSNIIKSDIRDGGFVCMLDGVVLSVPYGQKLKKMR